MSSALIRCRRQEARLIMLFLLVMVVFLYGVNQRKFTTWMETSAHAQSPDDHIPRKLQMELNGQIAACISKEVRPLNNKRLADIVSCLEQVVQRAEQIPDIVTSFLSQSVMYPHNHSYVINQGIACSRRSELEVLMVIPSAPHFSKRRQDVRESNRGKYMKDPANKSVLLFFLGLPDNKTHPGLQHEIQAEADLYGDIVQSDFLDTYKNIRLKAVSMLKWASTFCPNTDYVIRTDDDVNVTVTDLVNVMRAKKKDYTDFVIGRRKVGDVPARSNNKWHLSKEEYPHPTFPPYVLGGLIGYPLSTVKLLYEATLRYPPIWLDDVYVTGLCTQRLGIPVLADDKFDFAHRLKPGDFGPGVKIP